MTGEGRRARILHVIDGLGGSGGAENRLVEEVTRFDPCIEQIVVRLYRNGFLDHRLKEHGIGVVPLGMDPGRSGINWTVAALRLVRLIRGYRPDVVHTSLFVANLAGQLAATVTRTPVVSTFTLTGDDVLHRAWQPGAASMRAVALRAFGNAVGRRSGAVYRAVSEDAKATNCRAVRLDAGRVTVIPRGIDARRADAVADRERFGLRDGVPLFVNVARLEPQKGQRLLVHAFADVTRILPDAHLAIAGREGAAASEVRAAIREHGLEQRVHLLGFRPDVDVLLRSADVFMFSSLAEGLGSVVLEAVLAGLPVAAFDIPPVREATGDGRIATLVPCGDAGALGEAAAGLYAARREHPAAQRRDWVLEHWDLTTIAARVEALILSAAGSRAPTAAAVPGA